MREQYRNIISPGIKIHIKKPRNPEPCPAAQYPKSRDGKYVVFPYFILLKSPKTIIALLYNLSRCFAVIGAQKLKDSLAQLTRYKFHIVAV